MPSASHASHPVADRDAGRAARAHQEVRMRVPADFDRYKSDGRVIDIDVNDPSINQVGEPQDTPTAQRFADWLRANGWTVSTAHRGEMRIGA